MKKATKSNAQMSMKLINEERFLFINDRLRGDLIKAINTYVGKKKKVSQRRANDIAKMRGLIQQKSLSYHQLKAGLEGVAKEMKTGVTGRSKLKNHVFGVFKSYEYQEGEYLRVQNNELNAFVKNHPIIKDFFKNQVEEVELDVSFVGMITFALTQIYCKLANPFIPEEKNNDELLDKIKALEKEKNDLMLGNIQLSNENRRLKEGVVSPVDDYQKRYSQKAGSFF